MFALRSIYMCHGDRDAVEEPCTEPNCIEVWMVPIMQNAGIQFFFRSHFQRT